MQTSPRPLEKILAAAERIADVRRNPMCRYTCLPCGTLVRDGFAAAEERKKEFGAEKTRRDCVDVVFHGGGDTGAGPPGRGADLAYRTLSLLGTPELVQELAALRREWRGSGRAEAGASRGQLRLKNRWMYSRVGPTADKANGNRRARARPLNARRRSSRTRVEPRAVAGIEPLHALAEIRVRCLQGKVVTVLQQHVRVKNKPAGLTKPFQQLQEMLPIRIIPENPASLPSSSDDMVPPIGNQHAQRPSDAARSRRP